MKGKRQTIWLVSMLSLMVVLSAYYLFTEDSGGSLPQETAGTVQVGGGAGSGADSQTALDSGLVINEVETGDAAADLAGNTANVDTAAVTGDSGAAEDTAAVDGEDSSAAAVSEDAAASDAAASETAASDTAAAGDAAKDTAAQPTGQDKAAQDTAAAGDKEANAASTAAESSKSDGEILQEVASQSISASALFDDYLLDREQKNLKNYNDLMAQINDMDKTPAQNAVAQEQLNQLEEKESKINGIEEQLQQKYGQAIVKEEAGDSYTVVVLSDKLDVKQAVGIVDLVMKELSVSQNKIKVQYVSEQ
ncbi:SpoIIIAH-like family protein [Paenibacillus tengchongensis]|uniref:SpoIIIAH-like family protein n=1 Tax=Paenibacillus tengchongensis TaxID=2608684 RepID=UPI00124BF00C|nr:SpoIIIAH-like family protein [Paenibacillus tengchongensis]